MSTKVVLEVTPHEPIDSDRHVGELPRDIAALLTKHGQPLGHGLACRGPGPWRFSFQLSGPDRVTVGPLLERELRSLGYEADLSIWR